MDAAPVPFLPALSDEPCCHDCSKRGEMRFEVEDHGRGLLLVCWSCKGLRERCGRDPLAG